MTEKESLRESAKAIGFDLFGVCEAGPSETNDHLRSWVEDGFHGEMGYMADRIDLRADPRSLLPSARSIIAVGLNYQLPPNQIDLQPRIARYARGRDYHKVIKAKLRRLEASLRTLYPGAECRVCVDSAPILEREYAHRAGLGWFGKNTMLINSQRGSWYFLGVLLTSAEIPADTPSKGSCGSCRRCIDACPTGAIIFHRGRWQVDARRCISYLTIEHKGEVELDTHGWIFGCDVCQQVCPFNQPRESQPDRAAVTFERDFLVERDWPCLEDLSEIDYDAWDRLTRGSAVRRAGWNGLRRNARLALKASNSRPTSL